MEYISRIRLSINGQSIEDFKSFTEKGSEINKTIKLMNTTGVVPVTQRNEIELEYVVPSSRTPFDFASLRDGTVVVFYENGRVTTFTGVYTTKIGDTKMDGENEVTQTIEFVAMGRVAE